MGGLRLQSENFAMVENKVGLQLCLCKNYVPIIYNFG